MKRFRKFLFLFSLVIFSFLPLGEVSFISGEKTPEEDVTVYLFDDRLCPVCASVKIFLEDIEKDYSFLEVVVYPINDIEKLREVAKEHGVEGYSIMAPTLFIGDNFFQFRDFTSRHEGMIIDAINGEKVKEECCMVRIPFLDIEVDIGGWSLPLIAAVLGSVDGLNVCSIGSLILILSIVLVFGSKKKIFFFGGLFILTSIIIYGVLVFLWGRLFEILIGQVEILRTFVGIAALAGGVYFFKEFLRFFRYGPTCGSSNSPIVRRATEKLQKAFENSKQGVLFLAGAVVSFAAVITIVELPCSVGIPIAFSGILIEKELSLLPYVFYILLYLFFYMSIELVIFFGAVLTRKIWFAGSKTITWVTFLGAAVLFYLGFYYIFYN